MTLVMSFTGEVYRLHTPRETAHTSEVIRLAREAGIEFQSFQGISGKWHVSTAGSQPVERLARLISLAKAEEREACAVAAWSTGMDLHMKSFDAREIGSQAAQAIRARTKEAP